MISNAEIPSLVRGILEDALEARLDDLYQFVPSRPFGRACYAAEQRAKALRQIQEVRALAAFGGFDLTQGDERIWWDDEVEEDKIISKRSWGDFLTSQETEIRRLQEGDRLKEENARLRAERRALNTKIKAANDTGANSKKADRRGL